MTIAPEDVKLGRTHPAPNANTVVTWVSGSWWDQADVPAEFQRYWVGAEMQRSCHYKLKIRKQDNIYKQPAIRFVHTNPNFLKICFPG